MAIAFTIPGEPIPQPRHRAVSIGGKARLYLPTKHPVQPYKEAVALMARQAHPGEPLEGALSCRLVFILPRPKGRTRKTRPNPRYYSTARPDVDNLAKAVLDALNGLLFRDDSQIATLMIVKQVANSDEQPSTEVWLAQLPDPLV